MFYDQLNCLDMVLNEDIQKIFGHSFAFRTFSIFQPYSLVKDCQAHDCAVYIAMLMRRIGRPTQPVTEVDKIVAAVILVTFIISL